LDSSDLRFIATLRRERPEATDLLTALGRLHNRGAAVDWDGCFTARGARTVPLPTYAFQRQNYWYSAAAQSDVDAAQLGLEDESHPLLGASMSIAGSDGMVFSGRLSARSHSWLAEHILDGAATVPGSVYAELALHIADQFACNVIDDLTVHAPLVLTGHQAVQLQVAVGDRDEDGGRPVTIHTRADGTEGTWTLRAGGRIALSAEPPQPAAEWPPLAGEAQPAMLQEQLSGQGYGHGRAFPAVTALWQNGDADEVCAELSPPADAELDLSGFLLHPLLLESALQVALFAAGGEDGVPRTVRSWSGVRVHASGAEALRVRVRRTDKDVFAVHLSDRNGRTVATVDALALKAAGDPARAAAREASLDSLFTVGWDAIQLPQPHAELAWGAVGDVTELLPQARQFRDVAAVDATAVDAVLVPVGSPGGLSGGDSGGDSGGPAGGGSGGVLG
ncbi:polyketide synthase dehydratase domain-containing protein, partial [Streptomyces sp. B-S-A8]